MTRQTVARANVLVFGVLVAILFLVGAMTWDRFDAARTARQWSQHSYQVLGAIKDLNLAIRNAETGQRGYLLTGKDDDLTSTNAAIEQVRFLQGELQRLTADNPAEQERLHLLLPVVQHKLAQTVQ